MSIKEIFILFMSIGLVGLFFGGIILSFIWVLPKVLGLIFN